MPTRKIEFTEENFFHIYNRGNSKQAIFTDESDYLYFVTLLFLSNGEHSFKVQQIGKDNIYEFNRGAPLVSIGAYCLMPNHFHLLLKQNSEGGISKFMKKLSTGYSMYFNNKYDRTGSLFEGKFKAEHANDDRYLKYLFSYIHLNPLKITSKDWKEKGVANKSRAANFLEKYIFSSYQDYLGLERIQERILDRASFPKYFPSPNSIKDEVFDWIKLQERPVQVFPVED